MSLPATPPLVGRSGSFNRTPLFRLQSASLTLTDADKDANDVFNTNLGAINVQMAMYIHRIQIQCNVQAWVAADLANACVYVLSENTGATSALLQGNDTRALWLGERDWLTDITTTGMSGFTYEAIINVDLDPWPIITIAQQLNWLSEMVEFTAGTSPDIITKINIWYTLEPIDATLRSRLIERLNLAL